MEPILSSRCSNSGSGMMLVNGGTVTVATAVSVQNLTLSSPYYSGTLNGAGVLTVTGVMDWTGGSILGTGVVHLDGTTTISGSVSFAYGTIDNAGAVAFSGSGTSVPATPVWNNLAGSTFNAQIDGTYSGSGTGTVFNNAGTVVIGRHGNNLLLRPVQQYGDGGRSVRHHRPLRRRHQQRGLHGGIGATFKFSMERIPSMALPPAPGRG